MEGTSQNEKGQVQTQGGVHTLSTLSVFGKNEHFAYIYRKTEKLSAAVYMITNFIKDTDPLKWKIRENVVRLLSINASFATVSLSDRKNLMKEYRALALEIVSLFGIAHHSGLISEMNFTILSREFNGLISTLEKDENKQSEETVVLHPGFFEVEKPIIKDREIIENKAANNTVLYSHTSPSHSNKTQSEKIPVSQNNEPHTVYSEKNEYFPVKDIVEKVAKNSDPKDGRQTIIIKLLSKKSGLNVNDFVESIKGVSVKTIQRELLSMVATGVLKKEGERRWSTYSLSK